MIGSALLVSLGLHSSARGQCKELFKISGSGPASSDQFGNAIAMRNGLAVVGSWYDTEGSNYYAGSAYIFRWDGANWVQEAKLQPADLKYYDQFGQVVATDGTKVVVGCPGQDGAGTDRGAAYVYALSGGTWVEEGKLLPSDPWDYDYFGQSVAISGTAVVVGAPREESTGTDKGAVYAFRKSSLFGWVEERKVSASDGANSDQFGSTVVLEGTTLMVGATYRDSGAVDAGQVYVLQNSGTSWTEDEVIVPSDPSGYAYFGSAIALRGNLAVIGAGRKDSGGLADSGAAYVFNLVSSTWTESQILTASTLVASDYFGQSVATDGTTIVVGAPGTDLPSSGAGAAYSFIARFGTWTVEQRLQGLNVSGGEALGTSVAVDGKRAFSGAINEDGAASYSGAVYGYSVNEFILDVSPPAVNSGELINFNLYHGTPNSLTALCLASVNGSPFFMGLLYPLFSSTCTVYLSVPAPPGLSGVDLGFIGFKFDAFLSIAASNIDHVQFN